MAIYKSVRNSKGIKTLYHKIARFSADGTTVKAYIQSFVNADYRDREKSTATQNIAAMERQSQIEDLQAQMNALVELNVDESKTPEIQELSEKINTLVLDPEAPMAQAPGELHASELEIVVPYFEPLTMAALYAAIAAGDNELKGGEEA